MFPYCLPDRSCQLCIINPTSDSCPLLPLVMGHSKNSHTLFSITPSKCNITRVINISWRARVSVKTDNTTRFRTSTLRNPLVVMANWQKTPRSNLIYLANCIILGWNVVLQLWIYVSVLFVMILNVKTWHCDLKYSLHNNNVMFDIFTS